MTLQRPHPGEIVAAIGGAALFGFMFIDWFGFGSTTVRLPDLPELDGSATVERPGISGWDLQDFDGFLIAAAAVAGVALGCLSVAGVRLNLGGVPRGCLTASLGSLATGLILWRFLANPPGSSLEVGIFLALAAAVAITVGALLAMREQGFEPLVAAGSAAAKPKPRARGGAKRATPKKPSAARRTGGSKRSG